MRKHTCRVRCECECNLRCECERTRCENCYNSLLRKRQCATKSCKINTTKLTTKVVTNFVAHNEGRPSLRSSLRPSLCCCVVGFRCLTPFPPRRSGGMAENGISLPFARGALPRPSRCSHRSIRSPGGSENGRRHFPAIFLRIASPPQQGARILSGCEFNR